jgi:voltage-gated potassium channel
MIEVTAKKKIRQRIYEVLEKSEEEGKKNKKSYTVFNTALTVLICLNIIAVIVASIDDIYDKYKQLFNYFEYISIAIFTIEYLLRIWTASCQSPKPKIPYFCSFYGIVDLLAILPFYLPFVFGIDLRILRVFRLFRVVKLLRYNTPFDLIAKVLKNERTKLFTTIFIMVILILFASSMMYFFFFFSQQDMFPNIPATLWWAVATLTTVGYGDTYPITVLGKLLGGIIAVLGIGLVGLPSAIIASGLIQEIRSRPADPENIHSSLKTLNEYFKYISKGVTRALKILNGNDPDKPDGNDPERHDRFVGERIVKDIEKGFDEGIGRRFIDNDNNKKAFFIGLSPRVFEMKDGKDFVYSLAIQEKAINYRSIEKYPHLLDKNGEWIYIKIDKNIFSDENPVNKLSERIVDIVKNVYYCESKN